MNSEKTADDPPHVAVGRGPDSFSIERTVFESAGIIIDTHPTPPDEDVPPTLRTADGILHTS